MSFSKLFVPYELAKELKEKGFSQPCFGWFSESTPTIELTIEDVHPGEFTTDPLFAPLWQQVTDWLREKHNIHALVVRDDEGIFSYAINEKYLYDTGQGWNKTSPTYEEALEDGIKEALKLIP